MKPHDLKPFLVHRSGEAISPIATWDACTLEDLLTEPNAETAPGPWLASVYQRIAVASTGPVALGRTSQRLDASSWFHAAPGSDLDAARKACWPSLEALRTINWGAGALAPKLVLVGESSPKGETGELAFHSRSGYWLWRALRMHGWDELSCYVTNAFAHASNRKPQGLKLKALHDALDRYQPLWVALGQKASLVLSGAGIVHVSCEHPSPWYKFRHQLGPGGYAEHLRAQGVPQGAWFGQKLPIVVGEGEPALAARLGLPQTVAHKAETRTERAGGKGLEDAHRFFVLGVDSKGNKIETVTDAARAAGSSVERTLRIARAEKWEQERSKHRAKSLEKAKEKTADLEAQKIATCRSLAWTATALGLGSVVRRLQAQDGDLHEAIDPRQVLALGKLALGISQLGDPATNDEFKRVHGLGSAELLEEYKKVLGAFGAEPGKETTT